MKFSDLQTKQQQQIIQSVANASQLDAQKALSTPSLNRANPALGTIF